MNGSNAEVAQVSTNHKQKWKRFFSFLGPAYLVSVGYMDPGNWATDIAGGSAFGYRLIWVLLMSNIVAIFLQGLCVRLGIVYGKDLAQAGREAYPPFLNISLYFLAECAIIATDLAEVIGMAIGLNLLFHIPIIYGVLLTFLDTFLIFYLQRLGVRKMELFIISTIGIILGAFIVENIIVSPDLGEIAKGFIPVIPNQTALYLAIGMIGATVMPHNLYLHSALVQTRKIERTDKGIKRAIKMNFIDSAVALNLAFFVNAGILILAAGTFFKTGRTEVSEIRDAYEFLTPILGSEWAPILFAVALIVAGQSSTITATLAGQIVMEGHLRWRITPFLRRLISRLLAVVPSFIIVWLYGDKEMDKLLIFSQVILSLQLGFAIVPLVFFVSDKKKMGYFVIPLWQKLLAWSIIAVLLALNLWMVAEELRGFWTDGQHGLLGLFLSGLLVFLLALFVAIIVYPLRAGGRLATPESNAIHKSGAHLPAAPSYGYRHIILALDFSDMDTEVLRYGLKNALPQTRFSLIHIVESVTARLFGKKSADLESRTDRGILERYALFLREQGYQAQTYLGYGHRVAEMKKIIVDKGADLFILGAHRHSYFRGKIVFGTTIDALRKKLNIPILIVNT